jgi:hypothetical protein
MYRLGAGRALVVTVTELTTELDRPDSADMALARVHSLICAESRLIEAPSGTLLACRGYALCRLIEPVVAGTAVGAAAMEALLSDLAEAIADQWAAAVGSTIIGGRADQSVWDSIRSPDSGADCAGAD